MSPATTRERLRVVASFGTRGCTPAEFAGKQGPLATVVPGGLVSATFLTLIVLLTVYAFVYRKEEPAPPRGGGEEPAADVRDGAAGAEGAA